jgi:hypothetical protein
MIPMKLKLLLILMLTAHLSGAQNLFTKTISKLAKGMGKSVNVETSADLNSVAPLVIIDSNLHPDKVGTIAQTFFDGWVPGGDMAFLMFTAKKSSKFVKLDGTVTIDGKPVECLTLGMYTQTTPASTAARRVEITMSSGQKSSFTIKPFAKAPFKVKSINGSSDNASVDLTKDVVIELEEVDVPANGLLKVSIAINQVSIKSLYDIAFVRAGTKITIPANAFRNANIKPAGDATFNFKKSYIQVSYEAPDEATDVSGIFPAMPYFRSYSDGKFVNVTSEPNINTGLQASGTESNYQYKVFKANAFLSRPFSQAKKVGLLSFSLRGTSYKEVTQTTSTGPVKMNPFGGASSTTTVATITITKELPWEGVMEELYPEFAAVIQSELGATIEPVNKITAAPSYSIIEATAQDDETTSVEFARTYKNTKVISAFMPISEGYGSSGVYQKIMNESGTDALVTLTLDLQLSQESTGGKMLMIPKLAFEIAGKANGRIANTKFIAGTIESAVVGSFEKDLTAAQLSAIIRKSDLANALRKALHDMKEKEAANGDYEVVWNLQN